ncbi:MAG: glycosyltransferase family 4 protein [Bacillota bacterium]|nr:glycosyltransferase family 4 protein [Bacillota bacterium]
MKIWILNHYATDMYFDKSGRHQSIAKYLIRNGHEATIFCASTVHNSDINIDTGDSNHITKIGEDKVPYVCIMARNYQGNGKKRVFNMLDYYFRVPVAMKDYMSKHGKPDIILASSVHPLALVAGIKYAKKIKCPCVCEVRDLWPETFVELGMIKRESLIAKCLYTGEKWIYKRAHKVVFTMEGGADYIINQGWDKDIDISNVYHINNGVDLEKYNKDITENVIDDYDLTNMNTYKIIYTGSIRRVNRVDKLIDLADYFKANSYSDIQILIYGDGDYKDDLINKCVEKNLNNIIFKGHVEKQNIPYILSKGDINVITGEKSNLGHYGVSWNKLFEYIASGHPIIADYDMGKYNLIEDNYLGIAKAFESTEEFANAILKYKNSNDYETDNQNAVELYDFKFLAERLTDILQRTVEENKNS